MSIGFSLEKETPAAYSSLSEGLGHYYSAKPSSLSSSSLFAETFSCKY